ncbi:MAG TPA: hypothetical protein VFW66_00660 [Gemmatimonadales bacterium]|nr:hypothetical protein [Gemmatimonadales bacterium]
MVAVGRLSETRAAARPALGRWRFTAAVAAIFAVFVLLRIVAWHRTVLLEDSDSVGLVNQAKLWLTMDPATILAGLNPDNTPFVPVLIGLVHLLGVPLLAAGRVVSFAFSLLLFGAVLGIGVYMGGRRAAVAAVVLLACSATLVPLSFAVLTEPAYIATVYLGLCLFLRQYRRPTPGWAILLGAVFALAFLNRTEGLLFLLTVPGLQALHWLMERPTDYGLRRLASWSLAYALTFLLLVTPQLWRVSRQMHGLAMNGRQAWAVLLAHPDPRSREAKLWGLDYSPSRVNIYVVQSDAGLRERLSEGESPLNFIKSAVWNLQDVYRYHTTRMLGPLGVMLFTIGLVVLARRRAYFAVATVLLLGQFLTAPVVQYHVLARHVMVLLPLALIVAGLGAAELPLFLFGFGGAWGRRAVAVTGLACTAWVAAEALPLHEALQPDTFNNEYNPAELREPERIVRTITHNELTHRPVIAAKRGYLTLDVDGVDTVLPYTDLAGLTTYLHANRVDFLFLEDAQIATFPFLPAFAGDPPPPGYTLLYRKATATNGTIALYRVNPPDAATAPNDVSSMPR